MSVVWSFPTRIVFGVGAATSVGNEAKRLSARSALLVTDEGVRATGLADGVVRALERSSIPSAVYDGVTTNPTEAQVNAATEAYAEAKADFVVGLGGGASLDVAKLVRLRASHSLPLEEYDEATGGDAKISQPMPPMIAIPTTAGTGSEVGRSAAVTLASSGAKAVIFSPRLMPDCAVLDPQLTVSLPPHLTAAIGFDALAHNVEAFCAKGEHPMADAIALEGVELIAKNLQRAVEEPSDLTARGAMMKASTMGAVAGQKGLGVCHALAHPLGAELDLHHGLANALCLPAVLDFNRTVATVAIARVARILGVKGKDVETLAFECSGKVRALRQQLGLPGGLAEAGVHEDQLPGLAALAFADTAHAANPRACTKDDMLSLYRAAL
jgi:4-hydroxybutyrate dehydrogenase